MFPKVLKRELQRLIPEGGDEVADYDGEAEEVVVPLEVGGVGRTGHTG